MPAILPVCLSMIVCDQVTFDPVSGKPSILGVVHEIRCTGFPARHARLMVWAELTGARGALAIDFVAGLAGTDAGLFEPIAAARVSVVFHDPLDVRITGARLDSLVLAQPGSVVFRMAVGGAVIMERRVRVLGRDEA